MAQKRRSNDTVSRARMKRQATDQSSQESSDLSAVDAELSSINDLLQEEETSQNQTWQIGKRVKYLVESHEHLTMAHKLDAYFLWGTALARLASLHEDPTLAEAAADKFQLMFDLSQHTADKDAVDAALGAVGFSLWGSSLLIGATETQSRHVLHKALAKFQRAVEVDGGTTFETRFQYAKALKQGGEMVTALEEKSEHVGKEYYQKALEVCNKLEAIYMNESAKEAKPGEEETREREDDDTVTTEDFAEVKLLEAQLRGLLQDSSSLDDFYRTLALYQKAIALDPSSAEALIELTNYLAAQCLGMGVEPPAVMWTTLFEDLEAQYKTLLLQAGFELPECHRICKRKDTEDQSEPDHEETNDRVPFLLHALGKGLAAFVQAFPQLDATSNHPTSRFTHAVEVLRSAHHLHDRLGAYHLACLYASSAFEDEEQCRTWLETADSYGALEDEFDVHKFTTMHEKPWFKRLVRSLELIKEEEEDGAEDE